MSNFYNIKIKLTFGCGYINRQEDEEFLSDYWEEEDWNNLTEKEKERWLDEFWLEWKSNYEDGGIWLEGEED